MTNIKVHNNTTILITSKTKNWIVPPIFSVMSKPITVNKLPIRLFSHFIPSICSCIKFHILISPYTIYRRISIIKFNIKFPKKSLTLLLNLFFRIILYILQTNVQKKYSIKLHTAESFNFRGLQYRSRYREQFRKRVSKETLS